MKRESWPLAAAGGAVLIAIAMLAGCLLFAEPRVETPAALTGDYAQTLFDDSVLHTIDIRLPEVSWDYMVKFAQDEQYVLCDLIIDGETVRNASIRPKGNSSLSAISSQGSDRFSFKIEFDHETAGNTFHGLDKLALNNLGQDISCMKDYLAYHMMQAAGVAAPLSSFVQLKLNGEDFGLYLAVEAIEDSFAMRNYGASAGSFYKPECFAVKDLSRMLTADMSAAQPVTDYSDLGPGDRVDLLGSFARIPFEAAFRENMAAAALQYLGEEPERYQVFWDGTVFPITQGEKTSLIRAVKTLSEDPAEALDVQQVIAYFVVQNFVDNYDGYTGIFVHNYYLRESGGRLSLIPWDYNLAFGVFTVESAGTSILGADSGYRVAGLFGNAMDDKTNMVNYPIDTPTFTVSTEDRPLLAAVLQDPDLLAEYHAVFGEFLTDYFDSGEFERVFSAARQLIAEPVARGQTFYTQEQFTAAAQAVHDFCVLRAESIRRQLAGTLPATLEGQRTDYEDLVDASALDLAASVTFDGVVGGITAADVRQILDALAGDGPHTLDGLARAVTAAAEDPGELLPLLGRVLRASEFLQQSLASALAVPLLLIGSVAVLLAARRRVRRYCRRGP